MEKKPEVGLIEGLAVVFTIIVSFVTVLFLVVDGPWRNPCAMTFAFLAGTWASIHANNRSWE